MKHRVRALVLAVAAAAVGVVLAGLVAGRLPAAAAQPSGTYTITTCSPGTSAGAWQAVNQAPASLTAGNLCGNGSPAIGPLPTNGITDTGALFGEDQIGSSTQVSNLGEAGWQFTVPAGVTITGISYYGSFETHGDGWLAGLQINGQPLPNVCETNLQTADCDCRTNLNDTSPCQVLNDQVPQVLSNLNANSLSFGVACDQVQSLVSCTPGSIQHDAEADLYSAQVTLVESGGPQISSEGGDLWAGGPVWGTVPITFDASDPSGIASVDVLGPSGTAVADVPQSCDFSQVQACPELPSGQVQVNTLGLPDGPDRVSLKLTNAAGDTTAVQGPTVVVDNNGPPAPSSLTATAASPSSNAIDLSWSDPANPPEPIQDAYAQLCQSSCAAPVQVSTSGGAQVTAPAPGTYTVRVWLTDTAGRGSSADAATATVTAPEVVTTTTTTTSTTTTTTTKTATTPPCRPASKCPVFKIRSATWAHDELMLTIVKLPNGDRLQITLYYAHQPKRMVTTKKEHITIRTVLPTRLVLRALKAKRQQGGLVTVTKVTTTAKTNH